MQFPFSGFVVPPLAQTALLLIGVAAVVLLLRTIRPPITATTVLAFVPWMVTGAGLHVLYQFDATGAADAFPSAIAPLFSAPAVYLTTFVGLGGVWIGATLAARSGRLADNAGAVSRRLGLVGAGVTLVFVLFVLVQARAGSLSLAPVYPVVSLLVTTALTAVAVLALWRRWPDAIERLRVAGTLVVFAHLLDGVTTAIGYDLLGVSERSALPARIMEFAGTLPTAQYVGAGWLFVVVKLLVAGVVVVGFADYVEERPDRGYLVLAFVVAVGIGPATNNLFLFLLGG